MSANDSTSTSEQKPTLTTSLHPAMYYKGNASEAMDFYAEHLDGKVDVKMTYSMARPVAEEFKNCIMHGVVSFRGNSIFFSDDVGGLGTVGETFVGTNTYINLVWNDLPAMTKSFEGLSAGGKIVAALQVQPWGATYGAFVDKFDHPWSFLYQDPNASW